MALSATHAAPTWQFDAGSGDYRVRFNYSGQHWTHADVAPIKVATRQPIAVLPQQYTVNGEQPGAVVNGRHVGKVWNEITQQELARRLSGLGFHVLTPTIQMYGENNAGFQGLEHFIAGVAKGNRHVQVMLLTADAHDPNEQNPLPGAQMLVAGTQPRDRAWEQRIQTRVAPFYARTGLGNRGPRVRGGGSDKEGSSLAWHPLIERAAEYTPRVAIMEASRAIDIETAAGSIEAGRGWGRELFDGIALGMADQACADGFALAHCKQASKVPNMPNMPTALPAGADLDAKLQAIVSDPAHPLAGLSVLVLRDGQVLHQAQFGQRRIGARGALPVEPDTLFRMASVSKLVVAVGAMRLVEQGRLDLDADIGRTLGYALRNPHFPSVPITARMLLTHTSSLLDDAGYSFELPLTLRSVLLPDNGRASAAWATASADGERAPGRYFSYTNLNWGLLASVMEAATGERFDRLMQREVFAPLGLRATFDAADLSPAERQQLAALYNKQDPRGVWNAAGPWHLNADGPGAPRPLPAPALAAYRLGSNGTLFGPQGGLRISLPELAKLMQMLIDGGRAQGRVFLRPETVALMLSEQWRLDAAQRNGDSYHGLFRAWGLGLQRFTDHSGPSHGDRLDSAGGLQAWGHLGEAYGLLSGLVFDPVSRIGVLYAMNGTSADADVYLGQRSSLSGWEEQILDLLLQKARR